MKLFTAPGSLPLPKWPSRSSGSIGSKKSIVVRTALTCLLLLVLTSPTPGLAQKDNTGTNPANFTYDFRLIAEMAELDDPGGSALTTTFEFRWPLGRNVANLQGDESGSLFYDMGAKFGARIRARYKNLSVDTPRRSPLRSLRSLGDRRF